MVKQNIKLVALDMDGTLLDSQKNPPADFVDWVRSHERIQTVLASGRQYFNLLELFPTLSDRLIYVADNGGLVFRRGEMIYSDEMSRGNIRWCVEQFDGVPGLHLILCGAKAAYMKHGPAVVEENAHLYYARLEFVDSLLEVMEKDCVVKIAVFVEAFGAEQTMIRLPQLPEGLAPVLSGISWIDIANETVNKGEAIRVIQRTLGISREESMAFGDFPNDYELLMSCGESYAMANGHPKLKAIAKHIADSNDDDGVMKVLRQL